MTTAAKPGNTFIDRSTIDTLDKLRRLSYLEVKGVDKNQPHQLDLLFPTLYDNTRFIPNDYARSSLFTARNKKEPRQTFLHQKLFHLHEGKGVSILYSGTELRAEDDELVWLQIMHYSKKVPFGEPFDVSIKDFLRDLNWPRNGHYYNKIRASLTRLKASEVMVKNEKAYGTSGAISLIDKYISLNDSQGEPEQYRIWIDPSMIVLFAGNTFTHHLWEVYRDLTPVARRLADYIESHKHPYPISSERFRAMCCSTNKAASGWRRSVRNACAELQAKGVAKRIHLHRDDQIYVER